MLARREEARVVKRRREEMGAEVKPEVCIVGNGVLGGGGEGGGDAWHFGSNWDLGYETKQVQLAVGNLFRRAEFYFLAEDPPEPL